MPRFPTFIFQLSIMSKWLAKHINTKVPFKISIRKTQVYIDIRWPWIRNHYIYLGIWKDNRYNWMFCLHFSSLHVQIQRTGLNLSLLMKLDALILYMNIGISNWHNWRFDATKMKFFLYFCSSKITDSKNLKLFSTYLLRRKKAMLKTCLSAPQNDKEDNQLIHKNQERNKLFIDG